VALLRAQRKNRRAERLRGAMQTYQPPIVPPSPWPPTRQAAPASTGCPASASTPLAQTAGSQCLRAQTEVATREAGPRHTSARGNRQRAGPSRRGARRGLPEGRERRCTYRRSRVESRSTRWARGPRRARDIRHHSSKGGNRAHACVQTFLPAGCCGGWLPGSRAPRCAAPMARTERMFIFKV
jgi:hypothetical protein